MRRIESGQERSLGELSDQHRTRSREEVFGRLVDERGSDGEMSSEDESIAALHQHMVMCSSGIDGDVVFALHISPRNNLSCTDTSHSIRL